MANTTKKVLSDDIITFLGAHPNFALLKFEKTTHINLETLRKSLKKSGAKIKVVKNTLLQKAVNKLAVDKTKPYMKVLQKELSGIRDNTALLAFGTDWSEGMGALSAFTKTDKTVTFKVGCLDATTYMAGDLDRISLLPGRNVLMGTIIGSMKSPAARLTRALSFGTQKLVYILTAKSKAN